MPTRLYRPSDRPTILDRWQAHPWEVGAVAGVWVALGMLLSWSWVDPGGGPVTVLRDMPASLAAGVTIALLASGLGLLTAIAWPGKDSTAWRIELTSLPLGIAAWASYGLVSPSWGWQVVAVGYVVGGTVRWVAGWRHMRRPSMIFVIPHE